MERRGEDDWNIAKWSELLLKELLPLLHCVVLLLDKVPLIYHNHAALAVTNNQVVDIKILGLDTLLCVEHKHADIRRLDSADRAHYRVELKVLHSLTLLTHTCSVDKVEVHTILIVAGVNRVAGCTCDICHNVTLLTQKSVGHRRLTNIWTAYDSDARKVLKLLCRAILRQKLENLVHQLTGTAARHRADAEWITKTEGVELVRVVDHLVVVNFVADKNHALLCTTQNLRHHHIKVGHTCAHLNKEEDNICLLDCE